MNALSGLDASHGVSTGLITLAAAKGYTMYRGSAVPLGTQVEAGVVAGASAVVADSLLGGQSTLVKAGATGVVLSGAMWAWKGDMNWTVWLPVGAGAYWLSDAAMKAWGTTSASRAGGSKKKTSDAANVVEIEGM